MRSRLAAGLISLLPLLSACRTAAPQVPLEQRCQEAVLARTAAGVEEVHRLFPPNPSVINVTAEALQSDAYQRYVQGDMDAPYAGVLGELSKQLQASLGKPVIIDYSSTWCTPCVTFYKSHVVPFAERNPDVRVLLVVVDEVKRPLAGPEVQAHFAMMYRTRGFPQYVMIDEIGRQIGEPVVHFDKAVQAIQSPDRKQEDLPGQERDLQSRRGWFARKELAYRKLDRGGVHAKPVVFINKDSSSQRMLEDPGTYRLGDLERHHSGNAAVVSFIEDITGIRFPRDPALKTDLLQTLPATFADPEATPSKVAQRMADHYARWAASYGKFPEDKELHDKYARLEGVLRSYSGLLPADGPAFSIDSAMCVTIGKPSSGSCDYTMFVMGDWLKVFGSETGTEIRVHYNDALRKSYGSPISYSLVGASLFEMVEWFFLKDRSVVVQIEESPGAQDVVTISPK